MSDTTTISDLLYGVEDIAGYLGISKRAAYHLVERKRIPFFKIGRTLCARRSSLISALETLEEAQQQATSVA
jgi:excisionase family DNA binding protein